MTEAAAGAKAGGGTGWFRWQRRNNRACRLQPRAAHTRRRNGFCDNTELEYCSCKLRRGLPLAGLRGVPGTAGSTVVPAAKVFRFSEKKVQGGGIHRLTRL
jgi:hypothetical protein